MLDLLRTARCPVPAERGKPHEQIVKRENPERVSAGQSVTLQSASSVGYLSCYFGSGVRRRPCYCFKSMGGPLTRFPLRSTSTSTRSAILMKGMPLFIP